MQKPVVPALQGTDIRDAINPIRELSAYPSLKYYVFSRLSADCLETGI